MLSKLKSRNFCVCKRSRDWMRNRFYVRSSTEKSLSPDLHSSLDSGVSDLSFDKGDTTTVKNQLESSGGSENFSSLSSSTDSSDSEDRNGPRGETICKRCSWNPDTPFVPHGELKTDNHHHHEDPKYQTEMSSDSDDLEEDIAQTINDSDDTPVVRPKRKIGLSRRCSSDLRAVLTGFELETIEHEEGEKIYYLHRFVAIDADSIISQLDLRVGDCILRLNQRDTVEMTPEEIDEELSFNAEIYDLVIGREDSKARFGLRTIDFSFRIEKTFSQRVSSDCVSDTPKYTIVFVDNGLGGLEEDAEDDCRIIGRLQRLLSSKVYLIKHGEMHLACRGETVHFEPEYRPWDEALRFYMKDFKGISVRTATRIYCAVYPVSSVGRVLVAEPSEAVFMVNSEDVDGKFDQSLRHRRPLWSDDGIFTWKRVVEGKYVLESTQYPGHYLCAKDVYNCTIENVSNPSVDERTHFSRIETAKPVISRSNRRF